MNYTYYKNLTGLLLTLGLLGCSGGGSSAQNDDINTNPPSNIPSGTYTVHAVDDNIVNAIVNAPECASFTETGVGIYKLTECISEPSTVNVLNGFIDTNNNGKQDNNETFQYAPLKLQVSQSGLSDDFTVSPLTTLAAQDLNLSELAEALGISVSDLFKDTQNTRELQRAINALLISAREAGITKYDSFLQDLVQQIKSSNRKGLQAINDAKNNMKANSTTYQSKFGVVFGGFITDISDLNLSDTALLQNLQKKHTVPEGKIQLGGFIYDGIIANADITIYDGNSSIMSSSSDENGKYILNINQTILETPKIFKIVAVSDNIKLISYVTTNELKAHMIGQKISSANLHDLIVSNVTTAKAVVIQKVLPQALNNPSKMNEAKNLVESLYKSDIIKVAATIKDVVDNGKNIEINGTAGDTLELAQDIVNFDARSQQLTTSLPVNVSQEDITATTQAMQNDPLLNTQVESPVTQTNKSNLRSIMEKNRLYSFDYHKELPTYKFTYESIKFNSDGSNTHKSYDFNGTDWNVFEDMSGTADDIQWSSDGTAMYIVNSNYQPQKVTLLATEELNILGETSHIYFQQFEITAEPKDKFYTNFIQTSKHEGTLNFSSLNDTDKEMTINYESNNSVVTYHLNDNGTYYRTNEPNTTYKYRTQIKDGKTYIIFDDGQTHDGDGSILYLDFSNSKVYKKSYHNIGYSEYNITYDGNILLFIWKNLSDFQRQNLEYQLSQAHHNAVYSETNTWWNVTQKTIYQFIKSLSGANSLTMFLSERTLYDVTTDDGNTWYVERLDFSYDVSEVYSSGIDSNGAYNDTTRIININANSFTLEDQTKVQIVNIYDDYILVTINGVETRIYMDQQKAQAYRDSL
jgi:hypothetical protein